MSTKNVHRSNRLLSVLLRKKLARRGLSVRGLARMLDLSPATISAKLNNHRAWKVSEFADLYRLDLLSLSDSDCILAGDAHALRIDNV